jgi:hypothetical protein
MVRLGIFMSAMDRNSAGGVALELIVVLLSISSESIALDVMVGYTCFVGDV